MVVMVCSQFILWQSASQLDLFPVGVSWSRGECGKELLLKESLKLCLTKPERAPPARSQLLQLIKPVLKPWQLACKPSFVSKASRLSVRVFIVTNNLYRIKNEEYYFCRSSSMCCLGQHRARGMAPGAPGTRGVQAQSCLPQLSGGSCLFPLTSASLSAELHILEGQTCGRPYSWGAPGPGGP